MIQNISKFITALALLATAQGAWAWSGSGTAESPYQITSTADLDQLATDVNSGTEHEGDYFVLTTDLTYSHETDWNDASSTENNFTPIGGYFNDFRYFKGHFDGQGHTISGIRIYQSGSETEKRYAALFGLIDGAEVKNVFLADARFTGYYYCGPIVGYNDNGRVENCHVLSDVTVHTVTTNAYFHGGVVGNNLGTITGCTSAASITAAVSCKYNGGITGHGSGTVEDCIYFGSTVAGDRYVGAIIGYAPSGSTIRNCYYINDCIASATGYTKTSATVTDVRLATSDDFAVSGDTYTIGTAAGWSVMCAALYHNDTYNRFSGKTVQLGADITVTRMAGGDSHDFTGTFDGGGHTLTFNYTATDNYCAPFRHVQGASAETPAVISNLNVVSTVTADDYRHPAGLIAMQSGYVSVTDCNVEAHISNTKGTANPSDLYPAALVSQSNGVLTVSGCTTTGQIATDGKFAAGLVGIVQNTATIENCRASVTIQSTTSGDGTHGGLVASQPSKTTITITGCVFDGRLLGSTTNCCGGFIGYRKGAAGIYNSLFAPTEVTVQNSGSATFARNDVDTHNCYYTYYLCDGEHYVPYYATDGITRRNGHAPRTVAAAADVTIEAVALTGTATQYTVSGITAYSGGGLQRGETLYYGSGDQLSLTLSNSATAAPQGYQYGYTASAGTLSGSTLTMPDEDVTISAALAPIDWATVNQGNSADPYMIYNKDQLLLLAHRVNGTSGETANTYEGKYFKLGANITFSHPDNEGDDYAENYEAIGGHYNSTYRYFKGKFDGDGHTVSGIRIRKDGSDIADIYQGLFGCIVGSGAEIYDVHLTDARIIGYMNVGGIAGYNNEGYISGCTVTDSYITATRNLKYGTICGSTTNTSHLSNNYYHGCTVNGTENATNVGCCYYDIADITANHGALPAYRLALGENITTPPGTFAGQTEWLDTPPVNPRLAPENGFTLAGNHYFASGYEFTPGSTLASGAAQGYTPRATLGDELLDPYTHTGDADLLAGTAIARLTVTADCDGKTLASTEAIYSTGQSVTVAYINADGTAGEANAIALDGTETSLAAGTYFAGLPTVQFDHELTLTGDVTLILADNCHMNVGTSGEGRINGYGITLSGDATLDITSEANGSGNGNGALSIYTKGMVNHGINVDALTINGGHVTADVNGDYAVALNAGHGAVTINGGTLSATATGSYADAIYASGNVNYNGGTVTATAPNGNAIYAADGNYLFSWRTPADRITIGATGLYAPDNKTATFARLFTDATAPDAIDPADNYYGGTYTGDALNALAGKTLSGTEEVTLTEDNATQALAAINGMSGIGVTFNRAFTASKPSTICLPFDYTKKEGDGSFYAFTSIEHSGDEYIATMTEPGTTTLTANTPYLYLPSATGNVEFSGTPTTAIAAGTTTSDDWTFLGTYDEVKWDTAPTGIYGFSAQNVSDQGISQGEFVKVGAKVRIRPLRAYLKYKNGTENYSAAPTRGTTAELPDRIIVRLIGSDSNTTAIGTLDTRTGEVEIDTWYDLNGRKLSAKPTHRGIYINNGRKVVIK
ncbi:MAG: hypothetical protein E7101_08560 [Prevotella ruminicola]|uniref:The GLUG motif-containing protein n=1 Tax=Xylanibacter ruminicola TaxID=839 RepID=A0A9D5P534_XYLRU|nr:hypothetical protein [Xylanibacter ruminicola]